MTDRTPDAPAASGEPAPTRCEDCLKPVPAGTRPTWTRQHGARILCHACKIGY